jgi:hypothetical protein
VLPAALCCAEPPPASVAVAAPKTPASAAAVAKKDKSVQMDKSSSTRAPDAALLDYIGRYGDAAIGLDPLGLAADGDPGVPDKEPR